MQQIAGRPFGVPSDMAVDVGAIAVGRGLKVSEANLKRKWSAAILRWEDQVFEIRLEKTDSAEEKRVALAVAVLAIEQIGHAIDGYRLLRRGDLTRRDVSRDPAAAAALALVLPEEILRSVWAGCRGNIAQVARSFGVPDSAVGLRAEDIGLLKRQPRLGEAEPSLALSQVDAVPAAASELPPPAAVHRLPNVAQRKPVPQRGAAQWAKRRLGEGS